MFWLSHEGCPHALNQRYCCTQNKKRRRLPKHLNRLALLVEEQHDVACAWVEASGADEAAVAPPHRRTHLPTLALYPLGRPHLHLALPGWPLQQLARRRPRRAAAPAVGDTQGERNQQRIQEGRRSLKCEKLETILTRELKKTMGSTEVCGHGSVDFFPDEGNRITS